MSGDWPQVVENWKLSLPSRAAETADFKKCYEIFNLYGCLKRGQAFNLVSDLFIKN